MKRLEQIWRFIKAYRSQSFKAQENYLPRSQAAATVKLEEIPNPYLAGIALNPRFDPLNRFVGRQELAVQIEDAIGNTKHPTFFLIGERRMGKTGFLLHLPQLLKNCYIPVFCDLQLLSMNAGIASFLAIIAENIYEMVILRGYRIPRLEYSDLLKASKDGELVALYRFGHWLNNVVQAFDQNVHTLLLTFDEYEMLMWRDKKSFNLELLFDWFHQMIESNSCLIFLFCGVTPISDIDNKGIFSFNNIQNLKISFLRPSEARQLIVQTLPDFHGEEIFGEDVVEEIIRVTGGHPFLIQALCLRLIDRLNMNNQSQVQFEDLASALEELLERWEPYFSDLWYRTNEEERLCLSVLNEQGLCDLLRLQQQTSLSEQVIHHTIQRLLRRDLVVLENGNYRIIAPIFSKWVHHSKI